MASSSAGPSTTQETVDVKDNPYEKPAAIKCYRCLEPGYK